MFLCAIRRDIRRTVVVDSKETKVTFHQFTDAKKSELRKRWIIAIRRDIGKKPHSYSCFIAFHVDK